MATTNNTINTIGHGKITAVSYRKTTVGMYEAEVDGQWYMFDPANNQHINTFIIPNIHYTFDSIHQPDMAKKQSSKKPPKKAQPKGNGKPKTPPTPEPKPKKEPQSVGVIYFQDHKLNEIGNRIVELDHEYQQGVRTIREFSQKVFITALLQGKHLVENHDHIIETIGTQQEFAKVIGIDAPRLSTRKNVYKKLQIAAETDDPEKQIDWLKKHDVGLNARNFEKITRIVSLIEAGAAPTAGARRKNREQRLEDMSQELDSIERETNPTRYKTRDEFSDIATILKTQIKELQDRIEESEYLHGDWKNGDYRKHIKSLCEDMVTGELVEGPEALEIHHTYPDGSSGGQHTKPNDLFGIPVTAETHDKIEEGKLIPDPFTIVSAQFKCAASFILKYVASDDERS